MLRCCFTSPRALPAFSVVRQIAQTDAEKLRILLSKNAWPHQAAQR